MRNLTSKPVSPTVTIHVSGSLSQGHLNYLDQLVASAILDQFGWMDVPVIRLNWWRACGAIFLFAGALMMQHKQAGAY